MKLHSPPLHLPTKVLLASFAVGCQTDEQARSLLSGPPANDVQSFAIGEWDFPACETDDIPDSDGDGVHDECEVAIAKAFAPLLVFDPTEVADSTIMRETYWEVRRPFEDEELTIPLQGEDPPQKDELWIFYALGYHKDLGKFKGWFKGWTKHHGDSEFIVVSVVPDVNPNRQDQWKIARVCFSAHWGSRAGESSKCGEPRGDGKQAILFVAAGKHGSYVSKTACNDGGWFRQDTCEGHPDIDSVPQDLDKTQSWVQRVSVDNSTKLGPVKPDSMYLSRADSSRSEKLWNDKEKFCGWQGDRDKCAGSYVRALVRYRFDCTRRGECYYGRNVGDAPPRR